VFRQAAFRRSTASSASATSAPVDIELTMAETSFALVDTEFAGNQRSNRVVVFNGKINLPDWSQSSTLPGPFDLVIKFSTPWVFRGQDAISLTVVHKNGPQSSRSMDRSGTAYSYTRGTSLGTGCNAFKSDIRTYNNGNLGSNFAMYVRAGASNGPANSPVLLFVDIADQNLSLPGLCTPLRAGPFLSFFLGTTDSNGTVPAKYIGFPFIQALVSSTIYTQLLTPDATQPGIPFSLSDGQSVSFPARTTTGPYSAYQWTSGTGGVNTGSSVFFGGCPIVELAP
jgi:hypothetical protein